MIERIEDMPAGTIGLRASGKLTREDYQEVLEPALQEGVESGELRLLFEMPSFDGLEPGAVIDDGARVGHWLRKAPASRPISLPAAGPRCHKKF
jgi:hypothetical protein